MDKVALLESIAAGGATGSAMAKRFGVSRAMIWKAVEGLRAEGLRIEGTPGAGYRLDEGRGFGPVSLAWRCARPVHFFESCDSTNAQARRLLVEDSTASPLVVADAQTAGRGRRGRTWRSKPGENLLFSLVLRPSVVPQYAPRCVLAWAAAMAQALDVCVKWPNDLVTQEGAKLGGILAELDAEGDRVRTVILGVGINVNQRDFDALPNATSLAHERGAPIARAPLLATLIEAIEAVDTNTAPSLELWRDRSHTLGRQVRVGQVTGMATALRDDGALMVDGQAILAGDVELLGPVQ
jgi:BirA family biotin operon repressor/biotin-[acetyl-CoA-carboxylase] ligase